MATADALFVRAGKMSATQRSLDWIQVIERTDLLRSTPNFGRYVVRISLLRTWPSLPSRSPAFVITLRFAAYRVLRTRQVRLEISML